MPKELAAHGAAIVGLAFHPRKALLASTALDRMLCVWEPRKGLQPVGRANLSDRPECLWWHPKEASVVTADASGEIAEPAEPRRIGQFGSDPPEILPPIGAEE